MSSNPLESGSGGARPPGAPQVNRPAQPLDPPRSAVSQPSLNSPKNLPEPTRRSFSLRLNLWYAAFFTLSAAALFALAYLVLAGSIRQKEREILRTKLDEYRAWFESDGLEGLRQRFLSQQNTDQNAFFVQVIGRSRKAVFYSVPQAWQGFDLKRIEVLPKDASNPWRVIPGNEQHAGWLITEADLGGGLILQVGKTVDNSEPLLSRFRVAFGLVMVAVLILGFLGGAWLTHRALQPIRQLNATARRIIETGEMHARVPTRPAFDELDELVLLFNRVLEKNETLIRGMREALDNVAHDLRTPMARLRGTAEMALQNPDNPDAMREALADAMEESERALTMLKTLMDISEAEAGAMKLNYEKLRLRPLIQSIMELYQIIAEEKQIELRLQEGPEIELDADRTRLQQVLANLVDNAIKYTPNGGQVEVSATTSRHQLELVVRDNGMGIPADEIPRIWQRLYRGDKSRSQKGLGLGLSLVKAVVEAHQGQVAVESRPGQGSRFVVVLPLRTITGPH